MAKGAEEMPTVESNTGDGAAGLPRAAERSAAPPLLRRLGWLTFALCASLLLLIGLGFFWFLRNVPDEEVALDRNADGIVVLTGGASRIADAIELLASGRGTRLLISGVYHATTSDEIAHLMPKYHDLITCCVDLDYFAVNTSGNAAETRNW